MPQPLDPTLIRLHCDCELSPEQASALEHYLRENPPQRAAVKAHVDFEHALRSHVGAVMKDCPCAPPELVKQVSAAFAASAVSAAASEAAPVAGRIGVGQQSSSPRTRSTFWSGSRANVMAIAATLAVIGGAVLFGIFGRTIDDIAPGSGTDLIAEAAIFVDSQHTASASTVAATPSGESPNRMAAAQTELSEWLGVPVTIFDLQPVGYSLVSASHSGMPVPAKSAHLLYRKIVEPGEPAPLLSVFIVRDSGRCGEKLCAGLDPGKWCCLSEAGVKCKRRILRGTDGQLVYFLVGCNERDLNPVTDQIHLVAAGQRR